MYKYVGTIQRNSCPSLTELRIPAQLEVHNLYGIQRGKDGRLILHIADPGGLSRILEEDGIAKLSRRGLAVRLYRHQVCNSS